jgi:hypothetical protein
MTTSLPTSTTSLPARARRAVLALALVLLLPMLTAAPAAAQDAASIMDGVRATYVDIFDDVDNYVMVTDMYTTYHKKEEGGGPLAFKTSTQMKGQSAPMGGASVQDQYEQFDKIGEHGTYTGTETVNGVECHVVTVNDPSKVDSDLASIDRITYYIGVDDQYMHRMDMKPKAGEQGPTGMMVNFRDYRNTDGVVMPWVMEFHMEMSEAQKQQMKQMMEQMKQMPEAQRKRMEEMMGGQMQQMMSGEPMVIKVQSIEVNTELPDDAF